MSSAVVCIVMGSVVLISFMFCVWSCGPLRQLKCLPPPPPGGDPWGGFGKLPCLQCRFLGPCQNARLASLVTTLDPKRRHFEVKNDVILRSDSCLVHLLEITLPPRREHHFHCFERSANHLFLRTLKKHSLAPQFETFWLPKY